MRKELSAAAVAMLLLAGCDENGSLSKVIENMLPVSVPNSLLHRTCLASPWYKPIVLEEWLKAPVVNRNIFVGSTHEPDVETSGGSITILDRNDPYGFSSIYPPYTVLHTPSPSDQSFFGTDKLKKEDGCVLVIDKESDDDDN